MTQPEVDGYVIEMRLGQGATATVFRARPADDGAALGLGERTGPADRRAVVKIAHDTPVARAALAHEAVILRRLEQHGVPGVPRLVDFTDAADPRSVDGVAPALVLRPAGCHSLAEHLVPTGESIARTTGASDGRSFFVDLVTILAGVHAANVVHGDLSPTNIVLQADGSAVIVDFDAAILDRRARTDHVTGTPPYVAPELLGGAVPTPASDLYSLAMVMVTSLLPATITVRPGTDVSAALVAAGCSDALARVLARGTAEAPGDRFPSAEALRDALIEAGPLLPAPAARQSPSPSQHANAPAPAPAPVEHHTDATVSRDRAITINFGPRPAPPSPPVAVRGSRAVVLSAAVALIGFVLIGVGTRDLAEAGRSRVLRATSPFAAAGLPPTASSVAQPSGTVAPPEPTTPSPVCLPPAAVDPATTASTVLAADIDASGCPATIAWRRDTAEARVHSTTATRIFRLGQPGDDLLVGDWDGDGQASPALYRPATGEVFEFDAWASRDRPEPTVAGRPTGVRHGRAIVRHLDGHDAVGVEAPPMG